MSGWKLSLAMILCLIGGSFLGVWASKDTTQNQCNKFIVENYIANPALAACLPRAVNLPYKNLSAFPIVINISARE